MNNILKYMIVGALCIGLFFTTAALSINAESDIVMCGEAFNVGDRIYYFGRINSYDDMYILYDTPATQTTYRVCIYLVDGSTPSGKAFQVYNNMIVGDVYKTSDNTLLFAGFGLQGYTPQEYMYNGSGTTIDFKTNIPIFENKADADVYFNTGEGLDKAINYKKIFENGSWVSPFEDIEINDNEILVPKLSGLSHNGFTVTNNNNEQYMLDVYVDSGIQSIEKYLDNSTDISGALYANSFGLVSNNTEQAFSGTNGINLLTMYGTDNENALLEDLKTFYTDYPNSWTYERAFPDYDYGIFKSTSPSTFDIWGRYFGKTYAFWNNAVKINSSEVDLTTVNSVPICFTRYRVRFYYYDTNSGMHYGPWASVVYFSGGRVSSNAIFQDNNGNVIESGIDNGIQDTNGNIGYETNVNWLDLNNPNTLFSYIRTAINNVNATGNNFMTLFASVFSFIPSELQVILWLGVGTMILIGIIKALRG